MHQKKALLILLFMSSCGQKENVEQAQTNKTAVAQQKLVNRLDSSSFVVLPFSAKSEYLFSKFTPVELSDSEIVAVHILVTRAVAEHNKAQEKDYQDMIQQYPEAAQHRENYFIDLSKYKMQLIAARNSKGEKEVWVNCFCNEMGSVLEFRYWRTEIVEVDDGGNCFFNLKINLSKASWYDMMVNGIA